MRVLPVKGEPTRYWVESNSLQCSSCDTLFSRLEPRHKSLSEGSPCPRCLNPGPRPPSEGPREPGQLRTRYHLVDIACYWPVGECSCEHFQYRLKAELAKMSPAELRTASQRRAAALRCSHIEAARNAALDVTVHAHERERLAAGRGRTEEDSP